MSVTRQALKRATDDMLSSLGGQTKAAPFTRVGQSTLSTYASRNNPDAFAPIDVIADLEPLTREFPDYPAVTRALCAINGGVFVPLPDVPTSDADLLTMMGRLSKEAGDVTQEICAALSDGRIDRVEQAKIRREVRHLLEIAVALDAIVANVPTEEPRS
ncbi:phage regulatory CII family protein [Sphingomonas sp. Xoc002]|uniref:phage regulatory CII family protein n=1 Tax=Sphingomonas sp. Xoc002 TaxID=2837624 RepID=UPI003D17AF77